MSDVKMVNFRIGEDFGSLLYNLAHEKITCEYDMLAGLKVIEDSLIGIPRELVIDVIAGRQILTVDEEDQSMVLEEYDKSTHTEPFDWDKWCKFVYHKAETSFENFSLAAAWTRNSLAKFHREGGFDVNISVETLTDYVFSDDEEHIVDEIKDDILNNLRFNDKLVQCRGTAMWGKQLVEKTGKLIQLLQLMNKLGVWDDDTRAEMYTDYLYGRCHDVSTKLSSISSGVFETEEDKDLKDYIDSAIAVAETLKKGVKPVDYLHDPVYDAYWISPEGDVYGINGHIANMLHYQLADAIVNKTEIDPDAIERDSEDADAYRELESKGWAKITGNWVLFDGNHCKFTEEQLQVCSNIGQKINLEKQEMIRFGYCDHPFTGAALGMMDLLMAQKHLTI